MYSIDKKEMDERVRRQFRLDTNCDEESDTGSVIINERADLPGARVIQDMSSFFKAIIYRGRAYIMADKRIIDWLREKYRFLKPEWFCKYENLREIDRKLNEFGYEIADTHVYMLPDQDADENEYEMNGNVCEEWFDEEDIVEWGKKYGEENPFFHALVYSKTQPDKIALLLRDKDDKDILMGMSGASEDAKELWQIGIDICQGFEGRGLATYLTDMMKRKLLSMGLIPFYGTSESHSLSLDTGIRSGFLPAWAEVFVRKISK